MANNNVGRITQILGADPGRAVRGRPAVHPERADDQARQWRDDGHGSGAGAGRAHRPLHRDGQHRRPGPRQRGARHRRADQRPRRPRDAGPHPERARRADRRARPGRRQDDLPDPSRRAVVRGPGDLGRSAGDRDQGGGPAGPLPEGRQDRPVRRRRRRQDGADPGADQQHRQGPWRRVRVRRRRRAHPRGQRPVSRDGRRRRDQARREAPPKAPRWRWSTAR